MALDIHVLAWDRHRNVAKLNRLMIFQPPPLVLDVKVTPIYKIHWCLRIKIDEQA